jgi:hypothetical protein
MNISGRALKRLEKSFGDLRLCKDMLVVSPTDHIIRCFMFERTPYKGLFYFWRVVLPLYTQRSFVTLRYSKRLAKAAYIDLDETAFEQSIRDLCQIIAQGELEDLRSIRDPQAFLGRFGGASVDEGFTPLMNPFDAALTYYLVGNVRFCLEMLDDFAGEDLGLGRVDIHLSARDLARDMRIDPAAGTAKIRALEKINSERFGLGPTIPDHETNVSRVSS